MLGEALAAVALFHKLFCVLLGCRPVETMAKGFGHQGSGRCMVAALPLMYLSQQLYPFFWLNALLEDARHAALVQLTVDDYVCSHAALKSPGFQFILWHVPGDEVVGEWLRPGWYLPYVEDTGDQGISSPWVRCHAGFIWLANCGGWHGVGSPRVLRRAGRAGLAGCFLQP
jgi:hypothetical protein